MDHKKITFIGAGNMARSIIAGLLASGYPANLITATDPNQDQRDFLASQYGINTDADNAAAANNADVIVLAVKPQLMSVVAEGMQTIDYQTSWLSRLRRVSAPSVSTKCLLPHSTLYV
ncbi:pyrroline-5-carboxylate reductase [Vibrio ponticus]|nr:pyrroline-5-carboxylate reductase [Vibrio ponticus]